MSRRLIALIGVTILLLVASLVMIAQMLASEETDAPPQAAAPEASATSDAQPLDPATVALRPDNPLTVSIGRKIYRESCAACHGANLEGQPDWRQRNAEGLLPAPPHDPSGHTWHHPDGMLFALTKYGPARVLGQPDYRSDMPAYDGVLTDAEIVAVLSYIKSTWPEEIRARQDQINASSRR